MARTCAASWRISSSASGSLRGDDADLRIAFDRTEKVPDLAVYLDGERRLGQPGADGGGDLGAGRARANVMALPSGRVTVSWGTDAGADTVYFPGRWTDHL